MYETVAFLIYTLGDIKLTKTDVSATKTEIQAICCDLYQVLDQRSNKNSQLLDILDVLQQVIKTVPDTSNPAALVNRLVNYIRIVASTGKLHFSGSSEKLMIQLGVIGQKGGLNGAYMADFADKSYFYRPFEKYPQH